MQCNNLEEISGEVYNLMVLSENLQSICSFLGTIILSVQLQVHSGVNTQFLLCIRLL